MSYTSQSKSSLLYDKLSSKELLLIQKYAKMLSISPMTLLKNKTRFQQLFQIVSLDDIYTIHTIYHKLGLHTQFPYIIENSFQIPLHQDAYLITPQGLLPIVLERVEKNYLLWKIPYKSYEISYEKEKKVTIIFFFFHNIAYKMEVVLLGELPFKEGTYLKTSHSFYIETINKRKYPRLKTNIEAIVKKVGNLRDNPFYVCNITNISQSGIQIAIEASLFKKDDNVILRMRLDSKEIEIEGKIIYEKKYVNYYLYGIRFINMPSNIDFIIKHFIQIHQHQS